jgi:hypothetical protein
MPSPENPEFTSFHVCLSSEFVALHFCVEKEKQRKGVRVLPYLEPYG